MDNTKRRAGCDGRLCCQMKNMNYPRAGELHRRAGRQAALQDWPVGCTLRGANGLHIRLNWAAEKGGPEGCPFLQPAPPFFAARRTTFLCSPPFCLVFCAVHRQFTFFIWKHGPPARQLVLSPYIVTIKGGLQLRVANNWINTVP